MASVLPRSGMGFHVSMHDYIDTLDLPRRFGVKRCQRIAGMADQLYSAAITRDAISQPMATDLQERTGAPPNHLARAGLEPEDFQYLANQTCEGARTIRIAYAGTILVEKEFEFFVAAMERVRVRLKVDVSLEFFGDHSYAARCWFNRAWMRERGNLPVAELMTALRECTWGFSPMSVEDDDPRYNRYSLPTKFITYLAAGLPVITFGHPSSCVTQITDRYSVGLANTGTDLEVFARQLEEVLSLPNPWERYGPEILRCANSEFDTSRMRDALYRCFQDCAAITMKQS